MSDPGTSPAILIVDDNPASAKTLKLVLGAEGYEADCSGRASEALAMAGRKSYDAALIDLALPDRSGIELLVDLKGMFPDLISIIVTGHASTETSIQALNRGASGYVQKPVEVQQLLSLLRAGLDKRRLEEENWRMLRRLSLLHAIGAKVSVGLEPDKTLTETISLVVSLLELPGAGIWWADGSKEGPRLAASVGLPSKLVSRLTEYIADLLIQLAADAEMRNRPFFDTFEQVDGESAPWRIRMVPLRGHEGIVGCMAVGGQDWLGGETEEAEVLGAVAGQVGVAMENMRLFHDLRTAHERLKDAQARVVQSEKLSAVGRVVSGIAHELNNPLMAIIGYSEFLAENDMGDEAPEIARRVHRQAQRCGKIVGELLAYARQQETVLSPVDLNEIITASVEAADHMRGEGIEVVADLAEDVPDIAGDAGALQQVLVNIISNAYQVMNGGADTLSISSEVDDDSVLVRLSDTGPGIPDDVLPRIFDPFFTTKGVGQGTGLGLSVSHGIAQEHGGYLVADNLPDGGGAVFTLRLPVREPELQEQEQTADQDVPWLQ